MFIQAHKYKHIYASISEKRGRENERERVRLIQVFGASSHDSFKLKKLGGPVSGLKGDNKSGTA